MRTNPFLLLFICAVTPSIGFSKVIVSNTTPVQIPVNEFEKSVTSKDVQKIIPLDIRPSSDVGYVASKVGDRAFQTLMTSPIMQNSAVGRTAQQVEQSMKAEVSLSDGQTLDGEPSVQHKLGFSLLALQAVARMTYTGWVNAEVNVDAKSNSTLFQISEKVWDNKQMTLSHSTTSYQDLSALGLRWSF